MTRLPPSISLCHVSSPEPPCVTSCSARTPPISQQKTKFEDLKRIGVEVKKSLSSFNCFFQQSINHTKMIICLKSKTCHYCQSLVQTGSIPSKTGVHISNYFFNYTKILYWNFFYRDVTDFNQVAPKLPPAIYHHGESRRPT